MRSPQAAKTALPGAEGGSAGSPAPVGEYPDASVCKCTLGARAIVNIANSMANAVMGFGRGEPK